jgi:hypothetical protein
MLGNTIHVSFIAASEKWQHNKNGNRLRSEISDSASAAGGLRSTMEGIMRQQAREVTLLEHMIDRLARILEPRAAHEETQWPGMTEWLEDTLATCILVSGSLQECLGECGG